MPNYIRSHVMGGTYFFTLVTHQRATFLCSPLARQILRRSIENVRNRWPFKIDAFVLLPEHLHTIWTLPEDDADYSRRWAMIKKDFTRSWLAHGGKEGDPSIAHMADRRKSVWQRRFWEHLVRDEDEMIRLVDYIHYYPVKHGRIGCPHAWPYSSFHRHALEGLCRADWACVCSVEEQSTPDFRMVECFIDDV